MHVYAIQKYWQDPERSPDDLVAFVHREPGRDFAADVDGIMGELTTREALTGQAWTWEEVVKQLERFYSYYQVPLTATWVV